MTLAIERKIAFIFTPLATTASVFVSGVLAKYGINLPASEVAAAMVTAGVGTFTPAMLWLKGRQNPEILKIEADAKVVDKVVETEAKRVLPVIEKADPGIIQKAETVVEKEVAKLPFGKEIDKAIEEDVLDPIFAGVPVTVNPPADKSSGHPAVVAVIAPAVIKEVVPETIEKPVEPAPALAPEDPKDHEIRDLQAAKDDLEARLKAALEQVQNRVPVHDSIIETPEEHPIQGIVPPAGGIL